MTNAGLLLADDQLPANWLTDAFPTEPHDLSWHTILARLLAAFVVGLMIAALYRWTGTSSKRMRTFVATLTMLCILIALVTLVVRGSIARAFSLAGTLAIVRFRTVVEDTRDSAFVILAVVVGMALGGGHFELALLGVAVSALPAWLFRSRRNSSALAAGGGPWRLALRVAPDGSGDELREVLAKSFAACELCASETGKKGDALDLKYEAIPRPGQSLLDCVNALKALPGVQNVRLTRQ